MEINENRADNHAIGEYSAEKLQKEAAEMIAEFLEMSGVKKGEIVVIGCSSSEVLGGRIGKLSSTEAADAIFNAVYPDLRKRGIYLAAQCCEHLNRALIIDRECAERYGYEPVSAVPHPKAGGSFASAAYRGFSDPVTVEHIRAHAGIDIGDTLIGMHLREVAVPLRLEHCMLGKARLVFARTRPKYIGGERTKYSL